MRGWTDTLVTSFLMALITPGVLASTLPQTRDAWWALGVAFVVNFATNILQHRRQPPREIWTDEQRQEKAK